MPTLKRLFVLFIFVLCLQLPFILYVRVYDIVTVLKRPPLSSVGVYAERLSAAPIKAKSTCRLPFINHTDEALRWEGRMLSPNQPRWQRVDNSSGAFVYSAHYDDIEADPIVRVVGLARDPLPYSQVWCRYFASGDCDTILFNVSGKLYHFRHRNGMRYLGAYVDCPLNTTHSLPHAVSVDRYEHDVRTTFILVHYSYSDNDRRVEPTVGDGGAFHGGCNSSKPRYSLGESAGRGPLSKRGVHVPRWNLTRCVPALQDGFDSHTRLLEMVAVSRALGVERFVFYVESIGPDVSKALLVLERLGIAEVFPWNMHLKEPAVFYKAQFSAIQDCLYRHLHSSRYLLFGDVDEVFVPRSQPSLYCLLEEYFTKRPECGAFLFLNTFYFLDFPTESPPALQPEAAQYAKRHQVALLLHTRRTVGFHPPAAHSKPAVHPHRVETGSVHIIQTFRKNYEQCVMGPKYGVLHHYRLTRETLSAEDTVVDPFLWKHADNIVQEVDRLTSAFNQTISK